MARILIIGGGALGLSTAYHLAKRGAEEILLLERNQLTSGTSWHAAGIVGPLRATPNMTRLAMQALETFPALEEETEQSTGYTRTGGYWLARRPERMDELHRIGALGRHLGLDAVVGSGEEIASSLPFLNLADHSGALRVLEDANVNPVDLCMAYARAARRAGVDIREGVTVDEILRSQGRVTGIRTQDGEEINAQCVVLCAGAWSNLLAEKAGLALPLQAVEHMYVVTEPVPNIPTPFPVIRDLDTGIYIKGDAGRKLVIGGFEPNAKCWDAHGPSGGVPFLELPDDWDQFMPFMEAALDLMPGLKDVGIQHFMNGPESFTADTRPLVGEAPNTDGLFVAAGMNSVGVMSSAGIGKVLADWIVEGQAPMDLWEIDIARVDPKTSSPTHMANRMKEAVADLFAMHWPYKQPKAGRGVRTSCLHDKWREQGAVFGLAGGWERGLWYAREEHERDLGYSVGEQPWQSIAEREAAVMETGCALIDLSPFGKFDVWGQDAVAFANSLACADVDVDPGVAVYTPLLNPRGGVEADVTITRMDQDRFRITSAAATRWRDAALLRRHATGFSVEIADATETEAVIGVMGAGSRTMLAALTETDLFNFPFSTSQTIQVSGAACHATRLSFVGELGWELSVPVAQAGSVFDALIGSGASSMGHYALEACRIEKGFRAWGHDLGPDISPLEAGLGFTVCWDKDFVGGEALSKQRKMGVNRRLVLFSISGNPLMLHDEPIWEGGTVVGLTTSGGKGARTGLTLAFGLINIRPGETVSETCERVFEVEVAGRRHPAQPLRRPPYDPDGERMRA